MIRNLIVQAIQTTADLENELSRPTQGVLDTLRALDEDVIVLGAGGKIPLDFHELPRSGPKTIAGGKRSATTGQSKYHFVNAAI